MSAPLPPFVQKSITRLEGLLAKAETLKTHQETAYRTERQPSMRGFGIEHVKVPYHYESYSDSPELSLRIRHAVNQIAPNSLFERNLTEGMIAMQMKPALKALIAELKAGTLNDSRDLAHAEVFDDFLSMAQYLLDQDYKVAAVGIAGSSVETHLRLLANKNGIATTKPNGSPLSGGDLRCSTANTRAFHKVL